MLYHKKALIKEDALDAIQETSYNALLFIY